MPLTKAIADLFEQEVKSSHEATGISEDTESTLLLAREAARSILAETGDEPRHVFEMHAGFVVAGDRSAILLGADGTVISKDLPVETDTPESLLPESKADYEEVLTAGGLSKELMTVAFDKVEGDSFVDPNGIPWTLKEDKWVPLSEIIHTNLFQHSYKPKKNLTTKVGRRVAYLKSLQAKHESLSTPPAKPIKEDSGDVNWAFNINDFFNVPKGKEDDARSLLADILASVTKGLDKVVKAALLTKQRTGGLKVQGLSLKESLDEATVKQSAEVERISGEVYDAVFELLDAEDNVPGATAGKAATAAEQAVMKILDRELGEATISEGKSQKWFQMQCRAVGNLGQSAEAALKSDNKTKADKLMQDALDAIEEYQDQTDYPDESVTEEIKSAAIVQTDDGLELREGNDGEGDVIDSVKADTTDEDALDKAEAQLLVKAEALGLVPKADESFVELEKVLLPLVIESRVYSEVHQWIESFDEAKQSGDLDKAISAARVIGEATGADLDDLLEGMSARKHKSGRRPGHRTLVRKATTKPKLPVDVGPGAGKAAGGSVAEDLDVELELDKAGYDEVITEGGLSADEFELLFGEINDDEFTDVNGVDWQKADDKWLPVAEAVATYDDVFNKSIPHRTAKKIKLHMRPHVAGSGNGSHAKPGFLKRVTGAAHSFLKKLRGVKEAIDEASGWSTSAGGTSAYKDKKGYSKNTGAGEYHIWAPSAEKRGRDGYKVQFADTKALIGGGLWHDLGSARSPQAAMKMADDHFKSAVEPKMPKPPVDTGNKDAGGSTDEAQKTFDEWCEAVKKEIKRRTGMPVDENPPREDYDAGMSVVNAARKAIKDSEDESIEEVSVETNGFVNAHGKDPKGHGLWMFILKKSDGKSEEFSVTDDYGAAKKKAVAKAKEIGAHTVRVGECVEEGRSKPESNWKGPGSYTVAHVKRTKSGAGEKMTSTVEAETEKELKDAVGDIIDKGCTISGVTKNTDESWIESVRKMGVDEFLECMQGAAKDDLPEDFKTKVSALVENYKSGPGKKDIARKITAVNPIIKKKTGKGISLEFKESVDPDAPVVAVSLTFPKARVDEFLTIAQQCGADGKSEVRIKNESVTATLPKLIAEKVRLLFKGDDIHQAVAELK